MNTIIQIFAGALIGLGVAILMYAYHRFRDQRAERKQAEKKAQKNAARGDRPQKRRCKKCHTQLPDGVTVCPNCGVTWPKKR